MKELFIIRGVSGAGKSTLAEAITWCNFAADDYFTDMNGNYNYIAEKTHLAHKDCIANVEQALKNGIPKVAVANTFIKANRMKPYVKLAEEYGYRVHYIIVENRNDTTDVHNVPEETLQSMESNFQVKLR